MFVILDEYRNYLIINGRKQSGIHCLNNVNVIIKSFDVYLVSGRSNEQQT